MERGHESEKVPEAAYARDMSYHRAIQISPYEAVYGIKANREVFHSANDQDTHEETNPEQHEELKEKEIQKEPAKKQQKNNRTSRKVRQSNGQQTQKQNEARKKSFKLEINYGRH